MYTSIQQHALYSSDLKRLMVAILTVAMIQPTTNVRGGEYKSYTCYICFQNPSNFPLSDEL